MTMRFVDYEKGGNASSLFIGTCDLPQMTANKVMIRVMAFGINRADTLQRQGRYPPPPGESDILGLEVAGEVVAVGENAGRWTIGDKVFGLVAGGGYAEYVAVEPSHLMSIPQGLSYEQAAGIAEVYLTAFQCLKTIANASSSDKVLIHGGASGVGLAATQLAKYFGAFTCATASSEEKLHHCRSYGAELIVNYKTQNFVEVIKQYWSDGVDIVVDMVGGEYLNKNLKVLRQDGHIINIAMLGGRYADGVDMALLLAKRARIQGTTLRNRSDEYKTSLVEKFSTQCLSAFDSGSLKATIDTVYSVADIGITHQRLENNDTVGKLIAKW